MSYRIGIDVGGTFTDFALMGPRGRSAVHKTLSTPDDPAIAVERFGPAPDGALFFTLLNTASTIRSTVLRRTEPGADSREEAEELVSGRRLPFNNDDLFRHYPELDT